jgi:two-component system chemotaxis sensor kinase CheA
VVCRAVPAPGAWTETMNESLDQLIGKVDELLNRAACELVLGGAGALDNVRPALAEAGAALEASGTPSLNELLRLLREAGSADAEALVTKLAVLEATWNAWKAQRATDEVESYPQPVIPVPPPVRQPEPVAAVEAAADEELLMLMSDAELAGMFIAEALDHLSSIEALVLQVESQPDDVKLLNDVFRPFHTIKGNAGALGVTSVQELAHRVENLLDLARSGRHAMGADEIDVVLRAVDLLTTMIQALTPRMAGQPAPDVRSECKALAEQVDALINGTAAALPPTTVAEPAAVAKAECSTTGETSAKPGDLSAVAGTAAKAEAAAAKLEKPAAKAGTKSAADELQTVKVDTRKLDNMVDMVGELVIVQSIIRENAALLQLSDERLTRHLAQLKRITSDLQRNAMSMRMTPIRQTFQKMSRLVRDLSKKSGKTIDLHLSGEDTELDRKVVEDINDPLMHMVRNSIDHGIESPEKRKAAGKPAQARVSLTASHEGGNIVIAIKDDGAGLNTEKIRAKAIAQGVIAADAQLGPNEIHELIFRPGFSTADKVTEISGRGVGMDVVRRNIEALRGRIEIQTAVGQGTAFLIKLPLTLAILEGLLLRIGQQRFVLPTFCVRESLRPAPEQVHALQGRRRLIQVRDSLLPMIHLSELFGQEGPLPEPWETTLVVIEDNGRRIGLLVDELLGKQEVVIKALGHAFSDVRGVAGGAILGDGRVGLILDAGGLVSLMDHPLERAA